MPFEQAQNSEYNTETPGVEENVSNRILRKKETPYVEFYARARIIWAKFQQQQEDELHLPSIDGLTSLGQSSPGSSHGPACTTLQGNVPRQTDVTSDERAFVNAWALLLSRNRSDPNMNPAEDESALQVTATALQRTDNNVPDGLSHKYTLFIAKNGGLDDQDKRLIGKICRWMKLHGQQERPDLEIGSVWSDVLSHTIQSYLGFREDGKFARCYAQLEKLQEMHRTNAEDTGDMIFLSTLYGLVEKIQRGDSPDLFGYNEVLSGCYKFTKNNAGTIRAVKRFLGDTHSRHLTASSLLFVINGIEQLARIPEALEALIGFRSSHITDKAEFEVIQIRPCSRSALEYRPSMSRIQDCIKGLSNDPAYRRIREELIEVAESIRTEERPQVIVHCEMQVLNYILSDKNQIRLQEMFDFIGCSENPCFLCAGTINLGTSFKVAHPHGKFDWAWGIPKALVRRNVNIAHANSSLQHKMDGILQDEICRRSTSLSRGDLMKLKRQLRQLENL
ncbi:hypothetical protein F5Y05DRAFT_419264 [Hypoxylon sp. FL0543]|nr:hypothetical protein F5Y05DRAFT_419264 [Hypoxylon sp. FL0543]